ncbi:MAG: porin family protein [Pseudomonadales bacterium]|nr:porin family protein [Pseudomonadales bacterium]
MKNCIFNSVLSVIYVVFFTVSDVSIADEEAEYADVKDMRKLWKEVDVLRKQVMDGNALYDREETGILKGFYIGFGISMAGESFDVNGDYPATSRNVPFGFEPEYQGITLHATVEVPFQQVNSILNAIKINSVVGYMLSDRFFVEGHFDYIAGLDWDNLEIKEGTKYQVGSYAYVHLTTLTTSLKYRPTFFKSEVVKPFVRVGAGWMFADVEVRRSSEEELDITIPFEPDPVFISLPISLAEGRGYDKIDDFCLQLSVGVDVIYTNSIRFTFDASHINGLGEVDDLNFNKATAGIVYSL